MTAHGKKGEGSKYLPPDQNFGTRQFMIVHLSNKVKHGKFGTDRSNGVTRTYRQTNKI